MNSAVLIEYPYVCLHVYLELLVHVLSKAHCFGERCVQAYSPLLFILGNQGAVFDLRGTKLV